MRDMHLNARTEAIRRLARRGPSTALTKALGKARPEDVAAVLPHLTVAAQQGVFRSLPDLDAQAEVLANAPEESVPKLVAPLEAEVVVDLLDRMEPDDATDVVELLPDALRREVIGEFTEEVEFAELLQWPEDSAGGIMSSVVFKMRDDATCQQAIQTLQTQSEELETIYYVYVVNALDTLVGVISLRSLLTHPPHTQLRDLMSAEVITVMPTQDQEEVAHIVARYDLLALPVVDEDRRLIGIVTVDDIIDVIREEAAEDMMLMAGVNEQPLVNGTVFSDARHRGTWLLATIGGGIAAAEFISLYEETLAQKAVLAGFIPVIMGIGGNVGIQGATIAVRALATGRIEVGGSGRFILREGRVGVLLGVIYGLLLGGYAVLRYWPDLTVALAVGSSVVLAITLAGVLGALVPLGLSRLGTDPAVATGPFVTTLIDILGIVVYFNIARVLLGL